MQFADRPDGGRRLARDLTAYADRDDVVVLALPRRGLPVAHASAPRAGAPDAAPAFACPHCGARLGAGRLARADAFRRARWRYSRRAAATPPPEAPPAACPLPAGRAFTLREARPHWCYPDRAAWCCASAAGTPAGGPAADAAGSAR